MSRVMSEYEVESLFIERLESIGYKFIKLDNYDDVLDNSSQSSMQRNWKRNSMLHHFQMLSSIAL